MQDAIDFRPASFEAAYDPVTGVPLRLSTDQADYTYRVFTHCPCRGGGDVFHDFEVRDGRPFKSTFGYRAYETIPALFRYIANRIDARDPVLRVRYGASGRPQRIYTDSGEEANLGGNPGQFTIRTYRFRVTRR
jgi:hypothetical protein